MAAELWLKSYDPGVPASIKYPSVPIHSFLEKNAREMPDKVALIFQPDYSGKNNVFLTYRELDELSDRLAAALYDLGVRKGDRVFLLMINSPQFLIAELAVFKLGAVVVAANPLYSPREIGFQLANAKPGLGIVLSPFYPVVKKFRDQSRLERIIVFEAGSQAVLDSGDLFFNDLISRFSPGQRPRVEVSPDDLALLQYTGGTTGTPKGAMVLHRNVVANILQIAAWIPDLKDKEEVILVVIPLFHVYGMVAVNFGIALGSTLVMLPDPRDLNNFFCAVESYRPSIFPGVPTLYNAINNHPEAGKFDLRSIRVCISGSAPLMAETQKTFEALTGASLREGYGLSEAPTASLCNPIKGENRRGSIGLPLPDVKCKIVSLEDGVTELAPKEIGELVIKGPQVFAGYWQMPAETAAVLKDGWLFTGDLAKMDEDGYFYIVDRKKEMIIAGGYNIYPREIEEVIKEHPKVLEVAAAGIPDTYRGETVKVWVVLKSGESMTVEELKEYCKDKLARFKIPTHVEFRQELPKTVVGKILKRVLIAEQEKGERKCPNQ